MARQKKKCAVVGSGHIGTDLMVKLLRLSDALELSIMAGIDPGSEGLARATRLGVATTDKGVEGLRKSPQYDEVEFVFDATSAKAHLAHQGSLRADGKRVIDLTPAAVGPFVVPSVNLDQQVEATNINMVTCGGQATIPIVAAISRVAPVSYAEIIASIASRSAGPGTRANIDEFTQTTARGLEIVGGARSGKAIIILNPAEPPLIMRDTIFCIAETEDENAVRASVERMVEDVQVYVPGYRLKQEVQFDRIGANRPFVDQRTGQRLTGLKVSVLLEIEGAGHHLPSYAGNLDIMTSAALRTAERLSDYATRD